ncbi:hypothetical protein K432DRAFT_432919 [Lepidopterella palustris CBS 459.81]|uniref:Nuclear matrix protein n=1 Tax=Lepidopterella palustris CBS 459.81 TaxID=1314670 RepID=A0A8E2EGG4_9PEZI|nr:hypothetical protein K432DRAFT_432919 [Lepidopterella palustris CBS 459.81]
MAVSDIEPARVMTLRLQELLQRAAKVKKSTSVDPPLQISELTGENELLLGNTVEDKDMHKSIIERAARNIFYDILAVTPIHHPSFVQIWNLLDILQYCGDRDQCYPGLVLLLVEELLDSQSIGGCRTVFDFLESRREVLIATNSKNKDLVILRSCNELLRRLSRAEDAVFCGRVYIFLFQSFPLGDKSSVNLRGEFHVENVTTFEDFPRTSDQVEDRMDVESDRKDEVINEAEGAKSDEDALKSSSTPDPTAQQDLKTLDIDTLYPIFWSLQHAFSNPIRLFDEEYFGQFKKGLEATLAKFKEVPKVIQATSPEGKRGLKRKLDDGYDEFASTFNPKYLTSRDLFKLELSDLEFQRHILVQSLILLDFLLSLTEKLKKKVVAQKALQFNFTLGDQDAEWASGIKNSIANYLQEGLDGKFYYRMVDTVLSRDKNWVRWKLENCQPIIRDRVSIKDILGAKIGAQKAYGSKKTRSKSMGLDFKFLSDNETASSIEKLKNPDRYIIPQAESFARDVTGIDLDLEMATTEEEKENLGDAKASKTWRALRISSRDKLSLFDRVEDSKSLESLFQPETVDEATGEESALTAADSRDAIPQEHDRPEGNKRPEQRSQVMETAAE